MPIYKEKKEKLNLIISNNDNLVKITVNTFNNTIAPVHIYLSGEIDKMVPDDNNNNTVVIGKASELKDKTIIFRSTASNPDGNSIKVSHTIFEEGGNSLTYTFPDDYTGILPYDHSDLIQSYKFYVNFI